MRETFDVWLSAYALSPRGIVHIQAEFVDEEKTVVRNIRTWDGYRNTPTQTLWHLTKEAAIQEAEKMRRGAIEGLHQQIAKLEEMRFE